jgi:hypothetical protein
MVSTASFAGGGNNNYDTELPTTRFQLPAMRLNAKSRPQRRKTAQKSSWKLEAGSWKQPSLCYIFVGSKDLEEFIIPSGPESD